MGVRKPLAFRQRTCDVWVMFGVWRVTNIAATQYGTANIIWSGRVNIGTKYSAVPRVDTRDC